MGSGAWSGLADPGRPDAVDHDHQRDPEGAQRPPGEHITGIMDPKVDARDADGYHQQRRRGADENAQPLPRRTEHQEVRDRPIKRRRHGGMAAGKTKAPLYDARVFERRAWAVDEEYEETEEEFAGHQGQDQQRRALPL